MATRRVIVVGSGAGGLSAAAYLARRGFDVRVLEQAEHLGGLLAPFERDGYQFGPGVQYLGMCRPGQMVHGVLEGIGIDAGELFVELDPEGFDRLQFPGFDISIPRGLDAFRDRLRARFPRDDYGLVEVFVLARALYRWMQHGVEHRIGDVPFLELAALLRWSRASLGDLLWHFLEDPRSVAALAGTAGDYGLPPSRASALGALSVLAHYGDGAFFPRGGSGALRDALVSAGAAYGASYRTNAAVQRIVVHDGRAAGVELQHGETLLADAIVSDVDPTITFGRLVPEEQLPRRMRRKVAATEPSLGAFIVHLGMRRDVASRGLGRFNVWSYPTLDVESVYEPLFRGELPPDLALFISSGSAKDVGYALAPAGCSTAEIVTFAPHGMFAAVEGFTEAQLRLHGEKKRHLEERVLATLDRRFPGLIGDVEVQESSTPAPLSRPPGAAGGGAYGPAMSTTQWGPFRFGTRTPVQGLYLVGAGVLGSGVAASMLSGRMAATSVERDAPRPGAAIGLHDLEV
jgi:phytoene dehydrogenase-like protein